MSLQDLVLEYVKVRQGRMELERQANEIKEGKEAELKKHILLDMASSGIKSVNLAGIGRVVSRSTPYYEITDLNVLARAMFQAMLNAAKEGRPFSDGLLLQKRVNRESVDTLLEETGVKPEEFGVSQSVRTDLSITKTK